MLTLLYFFKKPSNEGFSEVGYHYYYKMTYRKYALSLRRCRQSGQAVGKPTDLVRLELTTMPFAGICSTTELPVHIGQVGSVATW